MAHAKSTLAEALSRHGLGAPAYSTSGQGPRHEQVFTTEVRAGDRLLGTGSGKTKRESERLAAEDAIERLENPAPEADDEVDGPGFDGPWPMFDDLLAGILTVAEKRIPNHLHGEDARVAIRDFTLSLYKELLVSLGDVVEEHDDDEDAEED